MKDGDLFVGSNESFEWTATKAKTIRGAKMLASKMFQATHDGKLKVGIFCETSKSVELCHIKKGFSAWT